MNNPTGQVNVDLNIDGEILNVEAIETGRNLNSTKKTGMNSMNMLNNSNTMELEKEGWRSKFFSKELCEGIIENKGDGNIEITGKLKIAKNKAKVIYWAANPPDFNVSFSGSGLPYPSPEMIH